MWQGEDYVRACRAEGVSERTAREWRRRGESDLQADSDFNLFFGECARAERLCAWARGLGIDVKRPGWNCIWDGAGEQVAFWDAYDSTGQLKPGLRIPTVAEVLSRAREEFGDVEDDEGDDEPWA
jgi:hypothetical protein